MPNEHHFFLRGTLAPFSRASDKPIAIACFRDFTFPPLPPGPLRKEPRLRRRIALSTRFDAALPYFRFPPLRADARRPPLRVEARFLAAITASGIKPVAGYASRDAVQLSAGVNLTVPHE
jgi:hypothetical protein